MASPNQAPANDGWTLVTRRRRPPHFNKSLQSPPKDTVALNFPSLTYAQVLCSNPLPSPNQPKQMATPETYIRSPQSPTNLRYPPNPNYKEWWGRCFRCARKGHVVAECKFPRTVAYERGAGAQQPNRGNTNAPPPHSTAPSVRRTRPEPSFEEFLAQSEPMHEPQMPTIRPTKVQCYFNRDEQYYRTLERMTAGVVILPPDSRKADLSLDHAAAIMATTQKVTPNQMQVARLSQERFLVLLPPSVNRDEVVAAIPKKVWDEGYRFQPYSPLNDASISIPFFKLWVDIKGVPIELHTEAHMARAVSAFGIYLGSMEPADIGDCQTWSVFIATDDLANVPQQIEFKVGGMVHVTQVCPRKWIKGQVFQRSDLPPVTVPYRPPPSPSQPDQAVVQNAPYADPKWCPDDDVIPMSLAALREIFRCTLPSELPEDLAACLDGDRHALEANHLAYRRWVEQSERERLSNRHPTSATPTDATPDRTQRSLMPVQSREPTTVVHQPLNQPTTVHRTGIPVEQATLPHTAAHANRGKRTQDDFALQVCTDRSSQNSTYSRIGCQPHELFPEISTPQAPITVKPKRKKVTVPNKIASAQPIRTSSRIKNKKNGAGKAVLDLQVQEFVDIPLKHAEGQEILGLIGASCIPIPSHLMLSSQQIDPNFEAGQHSGTHSKRSKQKSPAQGPTAQPNLQQAIHTTGLDPIGANLAINEDMAQFRGLNASQNEEANSQVIPPQGDHSAEVGHTQDDSLGNNIQGLDDIEEDPYLDQVDYSDGD